MSHYYNARTRSVPSSGSRDTSKSKLNGIQKIFTVLKDLFGSPEDLSDEFWTDERSFDFSCHTSNDIRRQFKTLTPEIQSSFGAAFLLPGIATRTAHSTLSLSSASIYSRISETFSTTSFNCSSPGSTSSSLHTHMSHAPSTLSHLPYGFFDASSLSPTNSAGFIRDDSSDTHSEIKVQIGDTKEDTKDGTVKGKKSTKTLIRGVRTLFSRHSSEVDQVLTPILVSLEEILNEGGPPVEEPVQDDPYNQIDLFGVHATIGSVYFETSFRQLTADPS
ncbi:hypothetical protein FRB93_012030 [Tulasnella sp. JGI-2019a]|nr:hypothetical protein FRB93_012030 [Tulasnella sp. JGI-2019a]